MFRLHQFLYPYPNQCHPIPVRSDTDTETDTDTKTDGHSVNVPLLGGHCGGYYPVALFVTQGWSNVHFIDNFPVNWCRNKEFSVV